MKCESVQNNLLREQTGELSWFKSKLTSRHLRECAECRKFREETALVIELGSSPDSGREARPDTMERIMQAAREEKSRSHVVSIQPARESFLTRRHPALIYAACSVILAFGVWIFFHSRTRPSDNLVLAQKETATETLLIEPEPTVADFSWDSPIESELATLNNALTTASAESIFPEEQSADPTQQDFDATLKELLELEGVKI